MRNLERPRSRAMPAIQPLVTSRERLQALASLPGTSCAISATHEANQRTLVSLFGLAAR